MLVNQNKWKAQKTKELMADLKGNSSSNQKNWKDPNGLFKDPGESGERGRS